MTVTFATNILMVLAGLFTGVLTARLLQADGRGEVAAVVAWALMLELVSSLGFKEAVVYEFARYPERARPIFATSILLALGTALIGVAVVQLALPYGLASQTDELLRVARVFMLMVVPMMLAHAMHGMLAATQRFALAGMQRVAQPALMAVTLVVLWRLDLVSVRTVLAAHLATWTVVALASLALVWIDIGIARPSAAVARRAFAYGIRVHGQALGSMANVRLDMMVMPAVLAAEQIGLYAVAVSAASTVMPLFAQLRPVLFPIAAGAPRERGVALVEKTLRVALFGATAIAVTLGLLAPFLVRVVYGDAFSGAVEPLRLLLPGIVAWSAASLMSTGLNAVGRPAAGSVAQLLGVVVTVVGLAIGLPVLGINGAALATSASYLTVFVVQLWMLEREPHFSSLRLLSPRLLLGDLRSLWQAALSSRRHRSERSRREVAEL